MFTLVSRSTITLPPTAQWALPRARTRSATFQLSLPLSPLTDLPRRVGETDQAFALASHLSTFSLAEVFAQPSVETGPSRVTQLALSECA